MLTNIVLINRIKEENYLYNSKNDNLGGLAYEKYRNKKNIVFDVIFFNRF